MLKCKTQGSFLHTDSVDSSMDLQPKILRTDVFFDLEDFPATFLCPISLEPMLDPVTLSTGQTYERANIQRWFNSGHFTCPITMQTISYDLSLTPNHTLRELIQDWHSRRGMATKLQIEDLQEVSLLLEEVRTNRRKSRNEALKILAIVAEEGEEKERMEIVQMGGVPVLLISLLDLCVNSEVACILSDLPLNEESKRLMMHSEYLSAIVDLLHEGEIAVRVKVARLIYSLISGDQERRNSIGTNPRVMPGLVSLLHENTSSRALLAALHVLQVLCSTSNQIKLLAARSGAVLPLVNLLPHPDTHCVEQSLTLLEILSTTREGCSTIDRYDNSIPNIVAVIMRISEKCNEYAVSILEALCRLDMEKSTLKAVKAGAVVKLLLIIQSSCCGRMKKRSLNLLKLLRHNFLLDTTLISDSELSQTLP